MVWQHGRRTTGKVWNRNTDDGFLYCVRVSSTGFFDGFNPHVEANVVRFHRVVGNTFVGANELVPIANELFVFSRFNTHEVVPCSQMANQGCCINA